MFLDLVVLCGVSWALSLVCAIRLWRRPDPVSRKVRWTLLLVIPIFGPLFYGGLYRPPPVQPEELRAPFDITRHSM